MKMDIRDNSTNSLDVVIEEVSKKSSISRKTMFIRLLKTFALFYSWICLGLYAEVLGPSLPTFMYQTNSNYEEISIALSIREFGMFIGSLVGAFFADRFASYRHYTISVTQILGSITIMSVPYCTSHASICANLFFSGSAHGAMTSNGNPLLGTIWGQNAGGAYNFMHSGYGVGGALAPLLLAPFTYKSNFTLPGPGKFPMKPSENTTSKTTDLVHMSTPCFTIGASCVVATIAFLFFGCHRSSQITGSETNENEEVESFEQNKLKTEIINISAPSSASIDYTSSNTLAHRIRTQFAFIIDQKDVLILIPSIFFLFFALVGNERVFSKFIYVAALSEPVNMNSSDSYLLTTAYWITFCLARILTVFVSLVLPVRWMFLAQLVGAWGMSLGLMVAPQQRSYYFAFCVLFGLFKSPLFPTGLSVINETIAVSGFITLFVNMGSSIGASVMQYLAGYLIQEYTSKAFPPTVMVTSLVLLFIGISLLVFLRILKRRKLASAIIDI